MGQAFDRDGNVLGEAYGDTKREVFDKLTSEFKNAHELRIKTIEEKAQTGQRDPVLPVDPMLQFFRWEHLPARLQIVSQPFGEMATQIVTMLPRNPERTVALRKLLEAKDCAVRALIYEG